MIVPSVNADRYRGYVRASYKCGHSVLTSRMFALSDKDTVRQDICPKCALIEIMLRKV